jgi:predicted Zn-dependent protease
MSAVEIPTAFWLAAAVGVSVSVGWARVLGAADQDLPDLGSPATAAVSLEEEYQVGRLGLVRQMRADRPHARRPRGQRLHPGNRPQPLEPRRGRPAPVLLLRDARSRHQRLRDAGRLHRHQQRLDPGDAQRERAGRRDGARDRARHAAAPRARLIDQSHAGLLATAAMLAAICWARPRAAATRCHGGRHSGAQSAAIQHQINYTRTQEFEADRIGIGTMASAGYDPLGMATMFEELERNSARPRAASRRSNS